MKTIEDYITERVCYDTTTGALTWRSTIGRAKEGATAAQKVTNGYLAVRIVFDGIRNMFMAHRVAWFLCHGEWPKGVIDHINNIKDDNRIANLRDCTTSQNLARRRMPERSLPRGVTYALRANKKNPYQAQVNNKGIGYFATPELASIAYEKAFSEVYGSEWRS